MEDLTKSVVLQWGMLGVVIVGGAIAIRALWKAWREEAKEKTALMREFIESNKDTTTALNGLTEVVKAGRARDA